MKKKENKKYMWLLLGSMFIGGLLLLWYLKEKKPCGCHSNDNTVADGGNASKGGVGTSPVNNVVLDTSPIVSKLDELMNELTQKGTSNCGC